MRPMIVEKHCPRCAIRRTVWLGQWGSFCHNCRLQWDFPAPAVEAGVGISQASRVETAAHAFSPAELTRLGHYRAAIRHGVYTDWPAMPEAGKFAQRAKALAAGTLRSPRWLARGQAPELGHGAGSP